MVLAQCVGWPNNARPLLCHRVDLCLGYKTLAQENTKPSQENTELYNPRKLWCLPTCSVMYCFLLPRCFFDFALHAPTDLLLHWFIWYLGVFPHSNTIPYRNMTIIVYTNTTVTFNQLYIWHMGVIFMYKYNSIYIYNHVQIQFYIYVNEYGYTCLYESSATDLLQWYLNIK